MATRAAGGEEASEVSEALRAEIETAMERKTVIFYQKNDFGDAGAVFLAEKLRGNTIVESFFLSSCGIGAVGARALAKVLAEDKTTLKHLDLSVNSLGDDGAEAMALMLRKNTTLEEMDLGHCGVGRRGARALGEALKENCTLKRFGLSGKERNKWPNPLGDDGAEAMAQMLRKNTTLEQLGLGFCGVSDRGARALCESLKENHTLKHIFIYWNEIGDDGANALAETLRWNESLEVIGLEQCQLTDVGASSLLAALRESNSTLTYLDLFCNYGINNFIEVSIQKLIEENKAARATAERRARCLLFCCLKLAPTAHEHVVPSIGAVPVPVMQYAVEHARKLHVKERFEHGNVVAGLSSAGVRARSSSSSDFSADSETATSRRR